MQIDRVRSSLSEHLQLTNIDYSHRRRNVSIACAIVFLIALGVRLLYWQDSAAEIARGDSTIQALGNSYREEAKRITDEGGILFPNEPVDKGNATLIIHPPGYSVIMAAAYTAFDNPDTPVRLTQIVLAAAQAAMIVLIAAQLFPVSLGLIAGLLAALSPHLAYYAVFLSPDSLAVLPILIAVYLIVRANKSPRLITIIAAGVMIGVSCWMRSNALFLSVFLSGAVVILFEGNRRWRYGVALIAATFLVIAPITLRNWSVYGRFIPISIGAGLTLVEGIAEYDKQARFGLPILDPDVASKEVEWHGRPDYELSLYTPDGIDRERARLERGMSVVRSNPAWFAGLMLKRMVFMLRYNDFRFESPSFNTPSAPAVLASPSFAHDLAVPNDMTPVWSRSMAEVEASFVAPEARLSIDEQTGMLQIAADNSQSRDQFIAAPIAVQRSTDYILVLQVPAATVPFSVKVSAADPGVVLASSRISPKKPRKIAGTQKTNPREFLQLHFATGNENEMHIAIANNRVTANERANTDPRVAQLGRADLFELGPTPNQWSVYPRMIIRGVQKTLYKTETMWLLLFTGVVLLLLARCWRAAVIVLAVPAYYLIVQSALHTEYRYILAIHYFLFICSAVSIYAIWRVAVTVRQSGS